MAVKFAVVAPAATVAAAGTVNAVLLSAKVTALPPAGAAFEIVTVQVDVLPDVTEAGAHCKAVTVGGVTTTGVTVSEAVAELPFSVAVTVTA